MLPHLAAATPPGGSEIFFSEFFGTAILIMFGAGTCATNNLLKSKGMGGGWLMINFGWGLAVYMGVYAAWKTGGHLNPAVTIAKAVWHAINPDVTLNGPALAEGGIPVTAGNIAIYCIAQFAGAFVGAVIAWACYKLQFDQKMDDPRMKLYCFATAPEVKSGPWNVVTEAIGTFALIAFVMVSGGTPTQVGPLAVALCIVVIGIALGGPTGYAINPARDLAPRVAYAILPMKGGKSDAQWSYAWVPIVGPIIGAVLAVLAVLAVGMAV
ncbi:aquaporin family protein [Nanchangia anserum]|uniref:Aquaporin family protein n=2 Tax=Nanchangia anserum TaxID=2692125 RepID=A0A8I0GD12_9ACTO|nr:MIP/aquaporin family protein [Nanchangia anserum]MBD3690016.1 aquaporin family protein [Nanchangia anserum]QOX82563.1 aquaporin family protein [Nanchangia anserum]